MLTTGVWYQPGSRISSRRFTSDNDSNGWRLLSLLVLKSAAI
ncbi:MAG: hypothetical protein P8M20_11560 [Planctomycetaceae bacterium]|nr:hypothetical protein [Planctomycetaceae bacterium]